MKQGRRGRSNHLRGLRALAEASGVEMPIAAMMRAVLENKIPIKSVPELIMTRQLRSETE